jgi:light-regulated signal transduction histidine kinase (bacteriophytochrome)
MIDKKDMPGQIRQLQHEADTARAELRAVHASLSWRITRPLRAVKRLLTSRSRSRQDTDALLPDQIPPGDDRLSPAAGRILKDLKHAVKNKEQKSQ